MNSYLVDENGGLLVVELSSWETYRIGLGEEMEISIKRILMGVALGLVLLLSLNMAFQSEQNQTNHAELVLP